MYQSGDGAGAFDIQIDAADASSRGADPDSSILFPDKDLLFTADYKKSGDDLLLLGPEKNAVILGYYKEERRPGLATREGSGLSGATVDALAGSETPGQYAQITSVPDGRIVIGRVEKASGAVTVMRNGVSVELRLGDAVAKGDVVQTGSGSSLTIKFNDGTVFSLSSNARMVLNDMVYAADSSANSALFTLVQGVIGFVAGRIAKTGDLKVDTPVATMAIRGTAVHTEISAFSGETRFSLLTEPDGTVGSFLLLDRTNPSRVITSISDARVSTLLTPVAGTDPRITQITKSTDEIRGENDLVRDLFQVFSPEPQRRGSSDPSDKSIIPVNLLEKLNPLDPSQLAVSPFIRETAAPRDIVLPLQPSVTETIRGRGIEDGPLIRLSALTDAASSSAAPIVLLSADLPPGVRYMAGTRSFTLDPSHPAYQHLGAGEREIVTVSYTLVSEDGTRVPATASWTVTGQNDAPVAAADHIAAIGETGRTLLALRSNDRDVDGDSVRVVAWTALLEGSLIRNSSGDLVFDPGDDFQALSAGQTATVSFTYTLSDAHGAMDTASVTLQVRGTGTFTSPSQSDSDNAVLGFNGQSVSLTVDAPTATTTSTANLGLAIGLGQVLQPQMNIVYLIDISGSTSAVFDGAPVGDLNGDGRSNTILDAEIASLIALTDRVRGLGFSPSDVSVTVIPFNGASDPANAAAEGNVSAATFSLGQTGDAAIADYLRGLDAGGQTNFANALRAANDRLGILDQGGESNFLYFLSDGAGQGAIGGELATLNDVYGAKITALGVGENANLSRLNEIDNTGGASVLTSPEQIDISVLGRPLSSGAVADIDVFVNGREIIEIGPEDLVATPNGLVLIAPIGELRRLAGDANVVSATITFTSGETLSTQLNIAGALPRSTDFIL
ncbi:Ig-like domain-containing protein [Microvirga zambiensis]|uniref:Ig-like domain-containing protein n=1 Tax=Microvirga zambiensis TaxID=1402137 RepID=UPI00191CEBF0